MHTTVHSWRFLLLIGILLLLMAVKLMNGTLELGLGELWGILVAGAGEHSERLIIHQVRLPQMYTALLAGAGLSMSGLVMQTLFRNPLAGPSVLGLSSGASLGAAVVVLAGVSGSVGQVGASVIGSVAVLLVVLYASSRVASVVTLLVFGLMLGYLVSAVVSVLQFYARAEAISQLVFWGMGSFSDVYGGRLLLLLSIILPLSLLAFLAARPLDGYLLGEEQAQSLGVNVKWWRLIIILIVGIITGAVTAYCGPIAFVGLAVPHMARLFFKVVTHRVLIPASLLCGAIVALFADIVSTTDILPNGIPLNAVLSIIGAPMVIWLVMRGHRYRVQV